LVNQRRRSSFACALRTWYDKKTLDGRKLECSPPSDPADGQAR
jgi:hypothetical protein